MYESVNLATFTKAFNQIRPDHFTPEALELIYEFITTYEDDTNMEVELDVIAICCDFTEMTQSEVAEAYGISKSDIDSVIDYLEDKTLFLGITSSDTFVFQNF
jgi:DNA-binding MarR family transcriptional regulator